MYKIVIIEDHEITRNNLASYLTRKNYKVIATSNGTNGLKHIFSDTPDIVICDIILPDIDGLQILNTIRQDKKIGQLPFLFLTACDEMKDLRKGMNLGADDYITKPFNPNELLKIIETRIELNKSRNTSSNICGQEINEKFNYEDTIFIAGKENLNSVHLRDIIAIKAENNTSTIMLGNKKKLFSNKLLKFWENKLPEKYFLRVHKSYLINITYVIKIEKWYNHTFRIYLENIPEPIDASRRYSSILKNKYII